MARRSSSRPLYELMSKSSGHRAQAADHPEAPGDDVAAGGSTILTPGRTIRVPVGYVLLVLAAVILLMILAYVAGSWQAHASLREASDREYLDSGRGADLRARASDPLLDDVAGEPSRVERGGRGEPDGPPSGGSEPPSGSREPPRRAETNRADAAPIARANEPQGLFRPRSEWGRIDDNPKQAGRFYLVLAETRPEGSQRLARYCRDEGLEAYVVQRHNARLRQVIVLPGFPTGSMSNPDVLRLRQEVARIGRAWKTMYPGESDLTDAYLSQ